MKLGLLVTLDSRLMEALLKDGTSSKLQQHAPIYADPTPPVGFPAVLPREQPEPQAALLAELPARRWASKEQATAKRCSCVDRVDARSARARPTCKFGGMLHAPASLLKSLWVLRVAWPLAARISIRPSLRPIICEGFAEVLLGLPEQSAAVSPASEFFSEGPGIPLLEFPGFITEYFGIRRAEMLHANQSKLSRILELCQVLPGYYTQGCAVPVPSAGGPQAVPVRWHSAWAAVVVGSGLSPRQLSQSKAVTKCDVLAIHRMEHILPALQKRHTDLHKSWFL